MADVVGAENLDHAIEILGLSGPQLVAARADRAGRRRVPQQGHLLRRLGRKIEQFFLEDPLDAVPGAVDGSNRGELAGRLDDSPQTAIDDRRWAAALRNDQIPSDIHGFYRRGARRMIVSPTG